MVGSEGFDCEKIGDAVEVRETWQYLSSEDVVEWLKLLLKSDDLARSEVFDCEMIVDWDNLMGLGSFRVSKYLSDG